MRTQWIGKNVDLSLLCEYIESFFEDRNFKTRREELKNQTSISAVLRNSDVTLSVVVIVSGEPKDFIVEIEVVGRTKSVRMFRPFLTMFGLGAFFVRRLRSIDFYESLEDEFWAFMDEKVDNLVGSRESK